MGDSIGTLFWFDHWIGEKPLRFKYPRLFELAVNKMCTVADMEREGWEDGGRAWVWCCRLLAWEEESVRECSLLLLNVVLQVNAFDTWRWNLDTAHGYSVKEAYRHITNHEVHVNNRIFQNEATHVLGLLEKVKRISFLWMKARNASFIYCYYDWWTHPLICMGVHQ